LGQEIDLLVNYPRTRRNVDERGQTKTEEDRRIARQFGREFFDGERRHGYGGFAYNSRFWKPVAPTFRDWFKLGAGSSLLDIGCAKGFMLYDFTQAIPGLTVKGIDVSAYAIENALDNMKPHVQVADAKALPFPDKSFDVVVSINTIHNLPREECGRALREIERVASKGAFVTVDAYRDDEERERMLAWNLTAQTIMHVDEWKAFFTENGYRGDYYWFIP
jgi:ubiquinone/menaquinone biosynthesis C-methylase UbiE